MRLARTTSVPALLFLALTLTSCTTAGPAVPGSSGVTLPAASCKSGGCSGTIHGANFQIVLPDQWNGTLLIYNHGYRAAQPVPPAFRPVSTLAEPAPGWASESASATAATATATATASATAGTSDSSTASVGRALLKQGYALAGSSYSANGWAVAEGVRADEDLYEYFRTQVGEPTRVYVWGESLGGLVTALVAEKDPDWVTGAASLCGVVAGTNPNFDLELDVAYATRELLWPAFKVTGYDSYQEAIDQFQGAATRIQAALKTAVGRATLLTIASLADAPTKTKNFDATSKLSQVRAAAESVVTALGYGTYGRYDLERRTGGNASTNAGIDYSSRISTADRAAIEAMAPGTLDLLLRRLSAGTRIVADTKARASAADIATPTGRLAHPMVLLHTLYDPLVIVQNESHYLARAAADGQHNVDLLLTAPPSHYAPKPGAPYGAGHCNFTDASKVGVIGVLDQWVSTGKRPTESDIARLLGSGSGWAPTAGAPAWPGVPA